MDDQLMEHKIKLVFKSVRYEVRHDIVEEGDGEALLSMRKIYMLRFWNDGHTHFCYKMTNRANKIDKKCVNLDMESSLYAMYVINMRYA